MNQSNDMNDQNNLMDQTALNIRSIVEPYEKEIKRLQEVVRQQEFQIAVLKQKLNKKTDMNILNNIKDDIQQINDENNKLCINLNNQMVNCFENDNVSILRNKLNIINGYYMTLNYIPLDEEKTIKNNEIKNNVFVEVKNKEIVNLYFQTIEGMNYVIALSNDCPLNIALFHFFIKSGKFVELLQILNGKKIITFLFNANLLSIKDEIPIGNIFKNGYNKIIVDNPALVGGNF